MPTMLGAPSVSSPPLAQAMPLPLQCEDRDNLLRSCKIYSLAALEQSNSLVAETGSQSQVRCAAQRAHNLHPQFSSRNCSI